MYNINGQKYSFITAHDVHLFCKVMSESGMHKREPLKPFLKWAGGKTQLIDTLVAHVPNEYGKYMEPFIGGGALFFYLRPERAVISDSNPELVNTYQMVRDDIEGVNNLLQDYPHDKTFYYELRARQPQNLSPLERAVRFIYLNKTCYNGLYRVNKKGEFNVPFGSQKNPTICDSTNLRLASEALQNVEILEGDYKAILQEQAFPNDFVYLDPPYYPISEYSDFKRYTKEFFYEEDHAQLASLFEQLTERGVWSLLTNSNTEFTRRLYQGFSYQIVETKRNINSNGNGRNQGQDLIVFATTPPQKAKRKQNGRSTTYKVLEKFPGTRFMGSKYNVLDFIWESVCDQKFMSVLDAFAGSGCVSYLFKTKGKKIHSNDLLHFSYHTANALIANNKVIITDEDGEQLLRQTPDAPTFIQDTFKNLYFCDADNRFLDQARFNIDQLGNPYKKSIALAALARACLKKRPRGIFAYVGDRYNDNRPDVQKSLREHFVTAIIEFNQAVINNEQSNTASNRDVFELENNFDLVYLDPPYYSPRSDSDYVRRYHFVEGLVRNWQGVEIQKHTKTKKFKKYPTDFDGKESTYAAFPRLFEKFQNSIIVVSYSSNSLPDKSELADMLKQYKQQVSVFQIGHKYSFGTQQKDLKSNNIEEYIFVGI